MIFQMGGRSSGWAKKATSVDPPGTKFQTNCLKKICYFKLISFSIHSIKYSLWPDKNVHPLWCFGACWKFEEGRNWKPNYWLLRHNDHSSQMENYFILLILEKIQYCAIFSIFIFLSPFSWISTNIFSNFESYKGIVLSNWLTSIPQ